MKTTTKLKAKLDDMVDKVFTYANTQHTVTDVSIDEDAETFLIKTDKNRFTRKIESAASFLPYWKQHIDEADDERMPSPVPANLMIPDEDNNLISSLTDILVKNIQKVQENPGYIAQAHAVNNGVKTIVELQKVKLSVLKEYNKKR